MTSGRLLARICAKAVLLLCVLGAGSGQAANLLIFDPGAVTWRQVLADADAIATKQALSFDVLDENFRFARITDEFYEQLDKQTGREASCAFATAFTREVDEGLTAINLALHRRIGVGPEDVPTQSYELNGVIKEYAAFDSWSDPSRPLTPISQYWQFLPEADLPLAKLIGRVNLAAMDLKLAAGAFTSCDDEAIYFGHGDFDKADYLIVNYLVQGDADARGIIEDVAESFYGLQEDERRFIGRVGCVELVYAAGDPAKIAQRLISYRMREDKAAYDSLVRLLEGMMWRASGQDEAQHRAFALFSDADTAFYDCASVGLSSFPPSIKSVSVRDSALYEANFSNFKGRDVTISQSAVKGSVRFDDIDISGRFRMVDSTAGRVTGSRVAIGGDVHVGSSDVTSITLSGSIEGLLDIWDDTIESSVDVSRAIIAETFYLTRSRLGGELKMGGLKAGEVSLLAVTGTAAAPTKISAYGAEIVGEFKIKKLRNATEVHLGRSSVGVVRFEDIEVSGLLNFWGIEADIVFVQGATIKGGITFWYAQAGTIELANVTTKNIISRYAEIRTRVYIYKSTIEDYIDLWNLTADDFWLNCSDVGNRVTIYSSTLTQGAEFGAVRAKTISLESATAGYAVVSAYNDDLTLVPGGASLSTVDTALKTNTDTCKVASTVDVLNLRGLRARTIEISGRINERLSLNDAEADVVTLRGERLQFSSGASVLARNAKIGVLALAVTGFAPDRKGEARAALDLDGSTIGLIKPHSSILDEGYVAGVSANSELKVLTEQNYRDLYLTALPHALKQPIVFENEGRTYSQPRGYDGAAFRLLRASASTQGYPAIARDVAVMQNDLYGQQIPAEQWGLRLVYFLGQQINDYGYDNTRAVAWLIVLWAFGLFVLNWDLVRFLLQRAAHWVWVTVSPKLEVPTPWGVEARPKVNFRGIFFSMDRTVPTLGLDKEFEGTGGMAGWRAVSLYLQRILSFVVILFMIGGALNFFQ